MSFLLLLVSDELLGSDHSLHNPRASSAAEGCYFYNACKFSGQQILNFFLKKMFMVRKISKIVPSSPIVLPYFILVDDRHSFPKDDDSVVYATNLVPVCRPPEVDHGGHQRHQIHQNLFQQDTQLHPTELSNNTNVTEVGPTATLPTQQDVALHPHQSTEMPAMYSGRIPKQEPQYIYLQGILFLLQFELGSTQP